MIDLHISFALPAPWRNLEFRRDQIGPINFLVGPNGSGKSRFAKSLKNALQNCRLLGTDRLQGMSAETGSHIVWGDPSSQGYSKNQFNQFRSASQFGSALDTFILLEERPDLRIIVEANLSTLFNRHIVLDWDSGNLVPKASFGGSAGSLYRLDRDECHGIKEMLIILTHLYNQEYEFLIIDEPELNLHPQYQSFLMQEIKKVVGRKKGQCFLSRILLS